MDRDFRDGTKSPMERKSGKRGSREAMCAFYLAGKCTYRDHCKFSHSLTTGDTSRIPQCKFWLQGICKFGTYCMFSHNKAAPPCAGQGDGFPGKPEDLVADPRAIPMAAGGALAAQGALGFAHPAMTGQVVSPGQQYAQAGAFYPATAASPAAVQQAQVAAAQAAIAAAQPAAAAAQNALQNSLAQQWMATAGLLAGQGAAATAGLMGQNPSALVAQNTAQQYYQTAAAAAAQQPQQQQFEQYFRSDTRANEAATDPTAPGASRKRKYSEASGGAKDGSASASDPSATGGQPAAKKLRLGGSAAAGLLGAGGGAQAGHLQTAAKAAAAAAVPAGYGQQAALLAANPLSNAAALRMQQQLNPTALSAARLLRYLQMAGLQGGLQSLLGLGQSAAADPTALLQGAGLAPARGNATHANAAAANANALSIRDTLGIHSLL